MGNKRPHSNSDLLSFSKILMCQSWSVQISKAWITHAFTAVSEYEFEVKKKKKKVLFKIPKLNTEKKRKMSPFKCYNRFLNN